MKIVKSQLQDENSYLAQVPVDIVVSDLNYKDWQASPVNVKFEILIGKQAWGISSMRLSIPPQTLQTEVEELDSEGNQRTFQLTFDPSELPMEMASGGVATLTGIKLEAKSDGTILYDMGFIAGTSLVGE